MLKPLEPKEESNTFFVVCDIEAFAFPHPNEGEVLAIDTAWREHGKIIHKQHDTWAEWWDWIVAKSKNDERFRTIYAHNGGGYDWISFVDFSLHGGSKLKKSLSAACVGSKMITLNIVIEKSHSIHLCDSLQLLRSKLADLANVFDVKRKVDLSGKMPHEIYETDILKFREYHRGDTETLLQIMERALVLMRDKVAKIESFGLTIGSTAMKVFRTMGLNRELSIPTDTYLKEFLRVGYRGGRVECFRPGIYDNINVYDINSLYPFAMKSTQVPVSDRGVWTMKYKPGSVACWKIKFNQSRRDIFPVLMVGGYGVYSGEGNFFTPELDLLQSLDPNATIDIEMGYEFLENDFIFEEYVDKLYSLRLQYPDSAVSLLAKYLLNSLYGKFGQHSEREMIVSDGDIDLEKIVKENRTDIRMINPRLGVCGLTRKTACGFEHVGIAGMITSVARVQLFKGLLSAGFKNVIYCDTDSVHTRGVLGSELVGKNLGLYKCEFTGSGVYAGKKLYALRSDKGKEKIRVKGVSANGNFGAKITFADIEAVAKGEALVCKFKQFSTPLEVFTEHSKPGVLQQRKRTIRRMKNG